MVPINQSLKQTILGTIVIAFAFAACNSNNQKKEQEDLQKTVIATHDSVMMEMSTLMDKKLAIDSILTQMDDLKKITTNLDTAELKTNLIQLKKELVVADDEMMSWMHNFNVEYTGKSHEEIIKYLNEQKGKINVVQKSFKSVIIKSDSIINKYK